MPNPQHPGRGLFPKEGCSFSPTTRKDEVAVCLNSRPHILPSSCVTSMPMWTPLQTSHLMVPLSPHLQDLSHNLTPHAHGYNFSIAVSDYTSSFKLSNSKISLSDCTMTFFSFNFLTFLLNIFFEPPVDCQNYVQSLLYQPLYLLLFSCPSHSLGSTCDQITFSPAPEVLSLWLLTRPGPQLCPRMIKDKARSTSGQPFASLLLRWPSSAHPSELSSCSFT